jgi:hypothetical protein
MKTCILIIKSIIMFGNKFKLGMMKHIIMIIWKEII